VQSGDGLVFVVEEHRQFARLFHHVVQTRFRRIASGQNQPIRRLASERHAVVPQAERDFLGEVSEKRPNGVIHGSVSRLILREVRRAGDGRTQSRGAKIAGRGEIKLQMGCDGVIELIASNRDVLAERHLITTQDHDRGSGGADFDNGPNDGAIRLSAIMPAQGSSGSEEAGIDRDRSQACSHDRLEPSEEGGMRRSDEQHFLAILTALRGGAGADEIHFHRVPIHGEALRCLPDGGLAQLIIVHLGQSNRMQADVTPWQADNALASGESAGDEGGAKSLDERAFSVWAVGGHFDASRADDIGLAGVLPELQHLDAASAEIDADGTG